jgi:hypothetical protein
MATPTDSRALGVSLAATLDPRVSGLTATSGPKVIFVILIITPIVIFIIQIIVFLILITTLNLGHVCFPKSSFQETTFQTFLCLFAIRKVGQ